MLYLMELPSLLASTVYRSRKLPMQLLPVMAREIGGQSQGMSFSPTWTPMYGSPAAAVSAWTMLYITGAGTNISLCIIVWEPNPKGASTVSVSTCNRLSSLKNGAARFNLTSGKFDLAESDSLIGYLHYFSGHAIATRLFASYKGSAVPNSCVMLSIFI